MGDSLSIVENKENSQEQFIQVPIKKKDFGHFVTNLLGQPETIIDNVRGSYAISMEWLIHIHHSLDQRIKQQSHSDLVDFSCIFKYREGPARKITTIETFLHFNEGKIVETESIEIIWTYLVNFPNKSTPEKQEISLKLVTDQVEIVTVGNGLIRRSNVKQGLIAYKISHTERTWGDDIQSILAREINSVIKGQDKARKWIDIIIPFFALGLFMAGLILPDYIDELLKSNNISNIYSSMVLEGQTIESLSNDEKLTLSVKLLDPNNQLHSVGPLYRLLSFFGGIFLAVITVLAFEVKRSSFILITNEDKKKHTEIVKKKNKKIILNIGSVLLSISASVVANYCYYYLNL